MSVNSHNRQANGHITVESRGRLGYASKSRSKYAPNIDPKMPQIPLVEEFKLKHIVQHHTEEETGDVVDSIINVARIYQRDLRDEIRKKLSIEQRIQYKNIELAKLVRSVKKAKQTGQNNGIDAGVLQQTHNEMESLIAASGAASSKARALVTTVKKYQAGQQGRLDPITESEYPHLYRFLHPHKVTSMESTKGVQSQPTQETVAPPASSPPGITLPDIMTGTTKISANSIPRSPSPSPSEMSAGLFEEFLSVSIAKYRERQRSRQQANTLMNKELDEISNLRGTPSLSFNPVKLLYSSILDTDSGVNSYGIKSPATSELTFQTSHFKKLRINGSPITSATYKKMTVRPKCECVDDTVSPARAALESLTTSDTEVNASVEYTSSDAGSVSSDDVSVSSDEFSSSATTNTNQYYRNLKSDLKRKRSRKALRKTVAARASSRESTSPTPRHKPSHRTLRPKNSILKTRNIAPKSPKRPARKDPSGSAKQGVPFRAPVGHEADLLSINTDSVQGTIIQLESETSDENEVRTYRGIDEDSYSSRSIERLRDYL